MLIYKSLEKCREMIESGTKDTETIVAAMREVFSRAPSIQIQYVSIVDAETLESLDKVRGRVLAAVAGRLGSARLIDNIMVDGGKE